MKAFIREYLRRRDGNRTPAESYRDKRTRCAQARFSLTLETPIEYLEQSEFEAALYAAASSRATHATFAFCYNSEISALLACDTLLETLFLPLKHLGVIGAATPLISREPTGHQWSVMLYPPEAIPDEDLVTFTPEDMRDAFLRAHGFGQRKKTH